MPVKIFFCYAHEDEELLKELKAQLEVLKWLGLIDMWHDRDISAGSEWDKEINKHLDNAEIILLLVSPDFMASKYCRSVEMTRAMERHERGEAYVIPVILRPVLWKNTPIGKLQALPTDGKPVRRKSSVDQDDAFFKVADSIRELAEKWVVKAQKSEFTYKQSDNQDTNSSKTQKLMFAEVKLSCRVGKNSIPITESTQLTYVLVDVDPTDIVTNLRMPLNIALVLDSSSSMGGAKLKIAKEAIKMLIDLLEPTDYISVVHFNKSSYTLIPSMPCNDKPGMKAAIDQIRAADGTTMSLGIVQSLNELRRWNIPNAINRMVLLTDGMTHGDSDRCHQLSRDAASSGIFIYPLSFGTEWNGNLLDKVGRLSGGLPAKFIQNSTDILKFFQQTLLSAADVFIRNATLILRLSPGVWPRRAVKVLPAISVLGPDVLSERQSIIPLGNLEKGERQSVLFELMVEPHQKGLFQIAQAKLDYDVPIMGAVGESTHQDVKVTFITDFNQAAEVDAVVMDFAEKANVYRLVMRVLEEYKRTGKTTTRLAPNVTRVLDQDTQAALEQIEQGRQISQEQIKSIANKTRKITHRLDDL